MNIYHHIFFIEEEAPALAECLRTNNIPHKNNNGLIVSDVLQNGPHWQDINMLIQSYSVSYYSYTTFSKKELEEAKWLCIRSKWLCGYPQPDDEFGYQRITYTEDNYCPECGVGLRQVDSFRIRQFPKWGNRHFMMLNWIEDEIFLDDTARRIFEKEFTGIEFKEVKDRKGRDIVPGIHQLCNLSFTMPGLIEKQEILRAANVCPKCGNVKYHPNGIGMYKFRKQAVENAPDICKTIEYFGWGSGASHLILIRQNVYRTIVDNHLDRGLEFSPIELV